MTQTQAKLDESDEQMNISRRDLMRGAATAGAGAVTLRAVDDLGLDLDPVDPAEANPAVLAVGVVVAAGVVASAIDGDGSGDKDPDTAAENTQAEQLQEQFYQAAEKTQKYNQRNLHAEDALISEGGLNTLNGLEQMAYEEGVKAAIDSMNNGATQAQTLENAKTAAREVLVPAEKYIFNEWKITLDEIQSYLDQFASLKSGSYLSNNNIAGIDWDNRDVWGRLTIGLPSINNDSDSDYNSGSAPAPITLLDGTQRDVRWFGVDASSYEYWQGTMTPYGKAAIGSIQVNKFRFRVKSPTGDVLSYMSLDDWHQTHDKLLSAWNSAEAELETYVNDTYSSWQSGDITKDDLLTSRMIAQQAAEDSETPRAVSDLISMGVETDLSRNVAISYDEKGVGWTLAGMMAATKAPSGGFEVGQSYTPNTTDDSGNLLIGSVYMAVDRTKVTGIWPDSGYTSAVDGGIIEITKEPLKGYNYRVNTTADETVIIGYSEWTKNNSGNWEVDASDRLENAITEVAGITLTIPLSDGDSQYIRENIDTTFTVEEIINEETGETFQTVEFEQQTASAPEDYRTAEDFEQMKQRNQELYNRMLERFKEVEGSGGGGLFDGGGLPSFPGLNTAESVAAVVLGFLGVSAFSS